MRSRAEADWANGVFKRYFCVMAEKPHLPTIWTSALTVRAIC